MPIKSPLGGYFGGKSGNGTYHQLINKIPPHDMFISLFLGNCGVTRNIRPAQKVWLNDLDSVVCDAWSKLDLPDNYVVTNMQAVDCIRFIKSACSDAGRKFLFLDPPYRKASRKTQLDVYNFEMGDDGHAEMIDEISNVDFDVMVTHYPDEMYDEGLKHWNKFDYLSVTRSGLATERIYYNYDVSNGILHDYAFIGDDFRQREKYSRIKNNMIDKLNRLEPMLRNAIISAMMPGVIAEYIDSSSAQIKPNSIPLTIHQ